MLFYKYTMELFGNGVTTWTAHIRDGLNDTLIPRLRRVLVYPCQFHLTI